MSRKKLQKYCNLTQVIKSYDSEFYDALDDLCLLPLLRPGPNGVTFCYPEDKALRKKIVDATYSKNPEVAVKMVKALIFRGCYKKTEDLKGSVTNVLNHMVTIKDNKWHGFTFEQDKDIDYFDHRSNISLLLLKGKGEIPVTGEMAPRMDSADMAKNRKATLGGGLGCGCMCWPSHRVSICKKLAKHYVSEQEKKSNAFVKKVYWQLVILESDHPDIFNSEKLIGHLGNEEVSDSYLLDMITPDDVSCKLWKALGQGSEGLGDLSEDMCKRDPSKSYYQAYIELKQKRIQNGKIKNDEEAKAKLSLNLSEQKRIISNIVSVCDIREALLGAYEHKTELGKDLFITYTSIMKEMWNHERDMVSFEHYSYMATNIYTSLDKMINQEFNQFKDATLHGNLLKSDIFKYVAWTDTSVYGAAGYATGIYPKPVDLQIFSLNSLVAGITGSKTGGSGSVLSNYM